MPIPGYTLAQMPNLIADTLQDIQRDKFIGTQGEQNYEPATTFINAAKGGANGIGWRKNIYLTPNTGATYDYDFHSDTAPQKGPPTKVLQTHWAKTENAGLVFDTEEIRQNKDDVSQIVDVVVEGRESNNEDIAKKFLTSFSGVGLKNSGDAGSWIGLRYFARRSQSSGAFVANTDGGFVGKEFTYLEGGNSTTFFGQDASLVENERLRNFAITHDGTMNVTTAQQVLLMMRRLNVSPFKNRKGELVSTGHNLFMSQTFNDEYIYMVNDGPDDRNGDMFPFVVGKLGGIDIKEVPVWNSETDQPIIVVKGNGLQIKKFDGSWFTEGKMTMMANSDRKYFVATRWAGQLLAEKATRECVAICHGSF